jgi:hypothetical protein
MSQSNANSEPTMDEILASIRKIISEDQPEAEELQSVQAAASDLPPEPSVEEPLAAPLSAPAMDVEDQPVPIDYEAESENSSVYEDEAGTEGAETEEIETIEPENYSIDSAVEETGLEAGFISESTREALDQAFDQIGEEPEPTPASVAAPGDGSLEAVFSRAVQAAFDPTLQAWVDNNGEEIVSRLAPLIREWMDENLPPLIEAAVTKEISRAVRARRR